MKQIFLMAALVVASFSFSSCEKRENIQPQDNHVSKNQNESARLMQRSYVRFDGTWAANGKVVIMANASSGWYNYTTGLGNIKSVLDVWLEPKLVLGWDYHGDNNQKWGIAMHTTNPNLVAFMNIQTGEYLSPGGPNGQLKVTPAKYYWYATTDVSARTRISLLDYQPDSFNTPTPTNYSVDFNWPFEQGSAVSTYQTNINSNNQIWYLLY